MTSRVLPAFLLPLLMLVGACAGDPCSFTSPCPRDTPPSTAQRDQCRATLRANETSPCYNEAVQAGVCGQNNTVCGGDGQTDTALTATRVQNNCSSQTADLVACCTRNPTASACR